MVGCSSDRSVELGVNNRDTITSSDPSEGEDLEGGTNYTWWYHTYTLDVEEGYAYKFTLTTINGNTLGIWSEDKGSWIVLPCKRELPPTDLREGENKNSGLKLQKFLLNIAGT